MRVWIAALAWACGGASAIDAPVTPVPQAPASQAPATATPAVEAPPAAPTGPSLRLCGAAVTLSAGQRAEGGPAGAAPTLPPGDGPVHLDLGARSGLSGDQLAALLHGPDAGRLVGLDLGGLALGAAGGKAIGSAPPLERLEALSLAGTGLGQAGIRGVAYGENLPALRVLSLAGAGLDDAALDALAGASGLDALVALNLQESALPAEQIASTMLRARLPALTCLLLDAGVSAETRAAWADRGVALTP